MATTLNLKLKNGEKGKNLEVGRDSNAPREINDRNSQKKSSDISELIAKKIEKKNGSIIKDRKESYLKKEFEERERAKLPGTRKPDLPDLNKISEKRKKMRKKKILAIGFAVFVVFLFCIYIFIAAPLLRIRSSVNEIKKYASEISKSMDSKDVTNLDKNVEGIRMELEEIDMEISSYAFLKTFGPTKGYYDNLEVLRTIVGKTERLIEKNLPEFKSLLAISGFSVDGQLALLDDSAFDKKEGGDISVDDTLDPSSQIQDPETQDESADESAKGGQENATSMILAEMPKYLALYEKINPDLIDIFNDVENLNLAYIPAVPGVNLRGNVESLQNFAKEFPEISNQAVSFLRYIPDMVGAQDGETSYLIILQNETEMRASGGLLTAFGNMTIENGEFNEEITMSDMWNLENYVSYDLGVDTGNRNIYGQAHLMNLGCGSTYLRAQDSGIYPDLYWTMDIFRDYYDTASFYNPEDFPAYDYILILNHAFAEEILSLVQPLEVEGYGEVTAENLFEFIKEETDKPELAFSPERKAIIKEIANAIKEKYSELPLSTIPNLVDMFVNSVYAKDLGFYSENEEIQNYFDKYSMSGRIEKDYNGDYFHFNEAQNCSLKLNKFVRDEITQDIYIEDDGEIKKDINIYWTQPEVYDENIKHQYDITGKFTYRAWTRVFAPLGVETFETDGLEKSGFLFYYPQEYDDEEMNKSMTDNIIRFDHRRMSEDDPIPDQDLNVSYYLPEHLNYDKVGQYSMLIQKHPGKSWGEKYTINIHHEGETYTVEFLLDRDKIVNYQNGIISVDNYDKSLDWLSNLIGRIPFESLQK